MSAQCGPGRRLSGPHGTVMEQYIEFFNGYRNAYGVADFNHQDSKIDPETGKPPLLDSTGSKGNSYCCMISM